MKRSKILLVLSLAVILSILAIAIPGVPALAAITLSVVPASGPPGTTVTISGGGYTPLSQVMVNFDFYTPNTATHKTSTGVANGAVDGTGAFTAYYAIPSQPGDSYNFTTTVGSETATVPFTITPAISVSTSIGPMGTPINVGGRGFRNNGTIRVYFDGNVVNMPVSDDNGGFSSAFNVPEAAQGKHTMYASDSTFSSPNLDFTVNPKISVSQTATSVGSPITVSGTGFTGSSPISFSLDGNSINAVASATTVGSFTNAQITIPVIAGGSHTLKAIDNSGFFDTAAIVTSQSFSIGPTSGPADTVITLNGGGFAANKNITVTYNNASIATTPSTVIADATGNFKATIAAPKGAAKPYPISVSDGVSVTPPVTFTITTTAKVDQSSGTIGSSVPVSGNGFNAGADITIKYDAAGVGSAKADANGAFSATFTVPPSLAGQHKIVITDGVNAITANFTTTAFSQISGPNGSGTQTSGFVGSDITLSGKAWVPGAKVPVTYDAALVATATVGADGLFSITFKAPISKGGNHAITATDGTNNLAFTFVMDSTPPPAPTPASPEKDVNAPALATFQWSPVTDPSGVTYTLQVAHDAGFNSNLVQKTGLTTPSYQLTDQEKLDSTGKDKPYYWRVRAIDAASNESPWSTSLTFTVGFIMPSWLLYFLFGVGAVIIFAVGFFVGKRTSRYGG